MSLSTVAEWCGSAIISNLVNMAYLYLGERMLPADTGSELRRLEEALPKIAAIMGVAEALKFKHPNSGFNAWVEQFKQAYLAAEDVLDEFKYWELEDMVKNRDQVIGSTYSIVLPLVKKKIGSLKRKFTGSTISEDTLKRLRGAVEMLNLAAVDVGHFFQFATALHVHGLAPNNQPAYTSSRETTSFLTESKVYGREIEKARIINWLKKPESRGNISAFCIVGLGGLGKTTLAQLILEKISRDNYFDKTIWVCISTSFSVQDITRKILEELGEKCRDNESLNRLQINLKEKVLSKKVLFILDDVWNDNKMCDWEILIAPLKFVQQGSKILLTTRMKSVSDMLARVLNVEHAYLLLEGLKEQELLELFNRYAFCGDNPDNHRDLQKIGNDIVKKLLGSPLAAKVIGSLLNSYMNFQYWKIILNHDSLMNLEKARDMEDVLKLSYNHLPAHLQKCFRFCSIFPQNYVFNKDELIKMWMASGFIRQELDGDEKRPEDIGEEYINHLFRKSLFKKLIGSEKYYVMHDMIHELAQNISRGECCRIEPNDKLIDIPKNVQHVGVRDSEIGRIFNLRNLRTLLITLSKDQNKFVLSNDSLKETLRLLVVHGTLRCELPEKIGRLIHLRFLKINGGNVGQSFRFLLPSSIYNLHHLQVLDIFGGNYDSYYEGVETTGINNLVSLRYMNLPDQVMQNIHGVHKLTSLQELIFFVGLEHGGHIDELGMLKNLRSLSIEKIENVGDPIEATNANISKKESLISLSLNWTRGSNSDNPEQVIDNLQPHPNLKELTIKCYTGHITPIWMRDPSRLDISSLSLDNCPLWEALPILGQMPHLKILSLKGMDEVKELEFSCNSTSECAFPSLERLYCDNMAKWKSWVGPQNCYGFPNLKELVIYDCPNLDKLPSIPCSLSIFEVHNVGLNSLPDMHHGSSNTAPAPSCRISSLRVVEIVNCQKLISLNGFLQHENLDLQSLQKLSINDSENLVQVSTNAFGKLVSLKHLYIKGSPKLVRVDNQSILLPVKLESLEMENCGELDVPLLVSAARLPALTNLYIRNSANIICIPSSKNAFPSLRHLQIHGCDKLIELSSMQQAHTVNPGNNLVSLKISSLDVDHLCLLLIEPLRNLRFVSELRVHKCSGMEALPEQWLLQNSSTLKRLSILDASSLQTLPRTMVMLTALEDLYISKATLLEEIPQLPTLLINKEIKRD